MLIAASVFVGLAALLHVYIFVLESVQWTRPATWRRFGVPSQQVAEATRPMAYNQGFYNLFLGIGAAMGLVLYWAGAPLAGNALVVFPTACMLLAALVLATTGRRYLRPALIQGTLPLIGLVLWLIALAG